LDQNSVGVVGSGLMGVGIATQAALHGYPTIVHDIDTARLATVHAKSEAILDELIDAGKFTIAKKPAVLGRIETTDQLEQVARAALVIEAIPEILDLKNRTYRALEPLLRKDAIFASNTSGFPPDLLAEALIDKTRFLIAHFWNPPHTIPLVEVVPGTATHPDITRRTAEWMTAIGMEPVVLNKAIPGFIGNRLQFAVLREALHIVRSGAASAETVDTVMKASLGRRYSVTGPLESADLGGLPTLLNVGTHLLPELAKDEDVLQLMRDHIDRGRMGALSGEGFYKWDETRHARVREGRKSLVHHVQKHEANDID
jgi:3-hydroxybutyryl-CoA dehydrogenase